MPNSASLVGRERELATLNGLVSDPGAAGVLVVRGDAGTGKSALLEEARTIAERVGWLVLRVLGVQAEARTPFAGLHQLLRPVLDRVDALPDSQDRALQAAFGTSDSRPEVFLAALAALTLLSDVAAENPVLLLVDDTQWIDAATLAVLGFLGRRLESDPVAMIATHRTGFDLPPELAGLPVRHLRPLDDIAAQRLLDARFPALVGREREQVLTLAAGNPLALLELPRAVTESRDDSPDDVPLTDRLERAFAGRINELAVATRELLLVLALDEQLSLDEALAATSRLTDEPVDLTSLGPAEAARLVSVSGSTVRFAHPLMSSGVRQAASTARRHAAHMAIAAALDRDPARSVWHRAACTLGWDENLAAELDVVAAQLRSRDGRQAVAALQRAGELSATPVRMGRRFVAAAEIALELGRDDEVARLLDRVEPLPADTRTRHAALWLREALREASGTATVDSLLGVAEQLVTEGEQRLALQALFTAAVRCYMFRSAQEVSEAIAVTAERLPLPTDDPTLAAIHALTTPDSRARDVVERLRLVTPDTVVAAGPDAAAIAEKQHLYALALTCIGEFSLGVAFQEAAISAFRAQGRLGLLSRALGSHAIVRLELGDWRRANQAADECLRLSGYIRGLPETATDGERVLNAGSCLLALGTAAAHQGRFHHAAALIDESDRVQGSIGSNYCLALLQAARASLALSAGQPAEGFQHAMRIYDPADPAHHVAVARWATVVRDLVDAGVASGNAEVARAALAGLDRANGTAEHRGTVAHADAVLAEDDFDARFETALALVPPSTFFQARLHLAYGTRLRRSRRIVAARVHLRSAAEGFTAIGAEPWAERARQELRASGETIRPRAGHRRDELSPQEMQIAELAAEGLSNREIAARLFVSHRTVGSHLYRIFPKLGITSRVELRTALDAAQRDDP
jgi:DNA-binding CsgD family transcriptional regulator/predicted nucleic acid-binding protein